MESRLDSITSWTSYTSLSTNEKNDPIDEENHLHSVEQALESSTRKATEEEEEDHINSAKHPKGARALHESLSISQDEMTQVNFQWMRTHPALLLQASAETSSSKISVQASNLVNVYAQRESRKRPREEDSRTTNFPSNIILPTGILDSGDDGNGLFCEPKVNVDLTKLFDPALHSEWLPGQNVSTTYGDVHGKNDCDECNDEKANFSDESADKEMSELKKDFNVFISSIAQEQETNSRGSQIDASAMKKDLMNLFTKEWMELLPSHEFMMIQSCEENNRLLVEGGVLPCCCVICRLILTCPSKSLGQHLLTVVIPVLFDTFTANVNEAEKVREIAIMLIRRCGLGKLTKVELINITKEIPRNDLGIELQMSIAKEFYDYNE